MNFIFSTFANYHTTAPHSGTSPFELDIDTWVPGTYPYELLLRLPGLENYQPKTQWEHWVGNLQITLDLAVEFGWGTCWLVKDIIQVLATSGLNAITYVMQQPMFEKYHGLMNIITAVANAMCGVAGEGIFAVHAGVSMTLTGLSIVSGAVQRAVVACISTPITWGVGCAYNTAGIARDLYNVLF